MNRRQLEIIFNSKLQILHSNNITATKHSFMQEIYTLSSKKQTHLHLEELAKVPW